MFSHLVQIGDEFFNPAAIAHLVYIPARGQSPASISVLYATGQTKTWTGATAERLGEIARQTSRPIDNKKAIDP